MASKFGGIPVDAQPQRAPQQQPVASRFGGQAVLPDISPFPEERGETRAAKELPELGRGGLLSGENQAKVAGLAPVLLATTRPQEIADILTANFPNIGVSQDPGGNLLARNNKTGAQVIINKPGLSQLDILQGLGIATAFFPAAKIASIPAQLGAKVALGGAAAAGTQSGIELIQSQLGGELDKDEIAIAGILGGAAETVVPAIQAIRQARQAKSAGVAAQDLADVLPAVTAGREASESAGIPLFQAQQTAIPAQLETQSFLAQLPASTQRASKALKSQNEAAAGAVDDLLRQIGPDEAVVAGAEKFRTAAQNAVERAKLIRSEKASPLFESAFSEAPQVNVQPVRDAIKSVLDDFPEGGEVSKSMAKVQQLISPTSEGAQPSLKKLQGAKLEIDQMINKFGGDSLGNTTKRQLKSVQSSLLAQMDEASPVFKEARAIFAEASPAVTKIQDSIIGKIAGIEDTQLKSISRRIFDPAETNKKVILNAKKIIDDVDPDAWNSLLRAELERRIGSVKADLGAAGQTVENIPGQLGRAIFGNKKQRDILFTATEGETRKNMLFLEAALKRASLGRPGRSQTAAREEIKRELRGGVGSSIRDFFRAPLNTLVSTGDDAAFNRRTRVMAEAMFDPQWKPRLKDLRELSPESPAAARAMTQLLKDIDKDDQ